MSFLTKVNPLKDTTLKQNLLEADLPTSALSLRMRTLILRFLQARGFGPITNQDLHQFAEQTGTAVDEPLYSTHSQALPSATTTHHHYHDSPFWWWYYPSTHRHYHYHNSSQSSSHTTSSKPKEKKDKEKKNKDMDVIAIVTGLFFVATGLLYAGAYSYSQIKQRSNELWMQRTLQRVAQEERCWGVSRDEISQPAKELFKQIIDHQVETTKILKNRIFVPLAAVTAAVLSGSVLAYGGYQNDSSLKTEGGAFLALSLLVGGVGTYFYHDSTSSLLSEHRREIKTLSSQLQAETRFNPLKGLLSFILQGRPVPSHLRSY